jgi:hypothetical protein
MNNPSARKLPRPAPPAQISDWRRDHTWKPEDEEQAETYLAQRCVGVQLQFRR